MAAVTGTLWDIGIGHLGGKVPELIFTINSPGVKSSGLYVTEQEIVTPASDGTWTANLTPTVDMLDDRYYTLSIRWIKPGRGNESGYALQDFPDWQIRLSTAGGKLPDLITTNTNDRIVWVSLQYPPDPRPFMMWLQMDPDNASNAANTGNMYEWRQEGMSGQWKYLANIKGPAAPVDTPGVVSYTLPWIPSTTTGNVISVRTPTFGPGKFGNALTGGVVNCLNLLPEPVGYSLTIECWVKSSIVPTDKERLIWGTQNSMWLSAAEGTGFARMTIAFTTGSRATSTVNICDGQWHHIAVELTRVAGVTLMNNFWVDGVRTNVTAPSNARTWPVSLLVGGHWTDATYDFPGSIDDVRVSAGRIYNGTFTPPTVAQVLDGRTLILAPLNDMTAYAGNEGYPARPPAAPDGAVTYSGPIQPSDWHTDDRWVKWA